MFRGAGTATAGPLVPPVIIIVIEEEGTTEHLKAKRSWQVGEPTKVGSIVDSYCYEIGNAPVHKI